MKALTKILLAVGFFLAAFIVAMIVVFCVYQQTPDILIQCVLSAGILEALLCAVIKCFNIKNENNEERNDEDDI